MYISQIYKKYTTGKQKETFIELYNEYIKEKKDVEKMVQLFNINNLKLEDLSIHHDISKELAIFKFLFKLHYDELLKQCKKYYEYEIYDNYFFDIEFPKMNLVIRYDDIEDSDDDVFKYVGWNILINFKEKQKEIESYMYELLSSIDEGFSKIFSLIFEFKLTLMNYNSKIGSILDIVKEKDKVWEKAIHDKASLINGKDKVLLKFLELCQKENRSVSDIMNFLDSYIVNEHAKNIIQEILDKHHDVNELFLLYEIIKTCPWIKTELKIIIDHVTNCDNDTSFMMNALMANRNILNNEFIKSIQLQ